MEFIDYVRQFKISGYAAFDLVLAFGGMYLAGPTLSRITASVGMNISRQGWLWFTLPIGVLVHFLVGSKTPMTVQFFDSAGSIALKAVVIFSFIMGLRQVKLVGRPHKMKK